MTAKFGPLARRVSCALVRGMEDRLITHLLLAVLVDVVVVVVLGWVGVVDVVVLVVGVGISDMILLFGCLPKKLASAKSAKANVIVHVS